MASFTYPQHLLHKIIEPQWFPYEKKEFESTLTVLEAAEEAHAQEMTKVVQMVDKDKIIIIGQRASARSRQPSHQRRVSEDTETVTTTPGDEESTVVAQQQVAPQVRFWNRRRSTTSTAIRSQPSF